MLTIPTTQFNVSTESPTTVPGDWLVLGVWADEPHTGPGADLVAKFRDGGDFSAKHLELIPVLNAIGFANKRVLFVGLGKRDEAKRATLHDAAAAAARHITTKKVGTACFALPSPEWTLAVGVGLAQGC